MSYLFILVVYFIPNSNVYCSPSSIKELYVGIGQQVSFSLSNYIDLPSPSCSGLVLTSNSANNYVGTVRPRRFTCYKQNLTYTHYGREYPKNHNVKLLLKTGNLIKKAVLHIRFVKVNNSELIIQPLFVQNAGDSLRLNKNHFQYTGHAYCQVFVARPPRHGALLLAKPDLWEYPCKQIATDAITYKHFRYGHDIDNFLLKITIANLTIHQQMKVYVEGGITNTPPHPVNMSKLYWLKTIDDTTSSVRLLYTIVRASRGINLLSSFSGNAITSFFQGDLSGSFAVHSPEDVNGTIRIQVMDDEEAVTIFEIPISCNILSRQFIHTSLSGIALQEGNTVRLINFPKLVENAEKYNISLYGSGPKLGKILVNGWTTSSFTLENVLSGAVYYENTKHGEWDPLMMKIEYEKLSIDVVYPIAIFSSDIRHPIIKAENSLIVRQNEVNLASLSVYDPDSTTDEINFRLEDVNYGIIFLRKSINEEIAVSEWNYVDMSEGRIIYRITERPKGGGVDVLKLKLFDSAMPSNISPAYHIKVKIMKDEEPPRQITNRPLRIGRTATRLTGLVYRDVWPPNKVNYAVEEKQLKGNIWLEDGIKVNNFSQSQLDRGEIWYEPASNIQDEHHSLHFNVTDGDGNVLTDQVLRLELTLGRSRHNYYSRPPEAEVRALYVDEGDSVELTEDILGLTKGYSLDLTFHVEQIPSHGEILVNDMPSNTFNMSQIISRDVSYLHDSQEIGETKLYDKFSLKLIEDNRDIWLRVIVRPIDDYPPEVFFKSKLIVLEGKEALLTTDQLTVIDKDTADNDIICFITAPPLFGILNNTFSYKDILDNNVLYIQSVHRKIEQTEDSFSLACHDRYNNSRNNFGSIPIEIVPLNDEPPVVTASNITDKKIALSRILTICDMDTPLDKLLISVVRAPDKGVITKKYGSAITNFTFATLSEVYYENWESGQDNFILAITDGIFTTEVIVRVSINELPPRLIVNEGLDLIVGNTELITSKQLFADDKDTQANDVIYVIKHAPMYGSLYLNYTELYPGFKFSQNDITSELVSYSHTDHTSFMDVFVFDLSDGVHTLFNENFFITIRDYNVSYKVTSRSPVIAPNTSITLNTHLLNVNNIKEENNKVTFLIMAQPKHGRIEYKSEPGQSIQTFTLNDLYEHNLQYVHLENTSATEIIQLEVNFGEHPIFHSFTIIIQSNIRADEDVFTGKPLQDTTETSRPELIYSKPVKILNQLDNSDGQLGAIINSGYLLSQDIEGYDVVYNVTDSPKFGYLYNINVKSACNLFTQDDVDNDLIYYYLNEDERNATGDSFQFDIIGHNSIIRGITFTLHWTWVNFKRSEILINDIGEFKIELVREGENSHNAFVELEFEDGNSTSDYYLENKIVYFSPGPTVAYTTIYIKKYKQTDELESLVVVIKKVENLVKRAPDKILLLFEENYSNNEVTEIHETTTHQDIDNLTENLIHSQERKLSCTAQNNTYFQFSKEIYKVQETDGFVDVEILRSGDLMTTSSVLCYTSENLASFDDFVPRPRNRTSEILFLPGTTRENCVVKILNDEVHEREEDFIIHLKCFNKNTKLKKKLTATVYINDEEDEEIVRFENNHYFVKEPINSESNVTLKIKILRLGDTTYGRHVKVIALDGSAKSDIDYIAKQNVIAFEPRKRTKHYEVIILKDKFVEPREFFTLKLEMLAVGNIKKSHQATIHISDGPQPGSDVFPEPPSVISLKHYNSTKGVSAQPIQGYPLVCVIVCDRNHKQYIKYQSWCKNKKINVKECIYHWQIENLQGEMRDVASIIFFANTSLQTLDSVYFRGDYRVRCGARPVENGVVGKELFSQIVTISNKHGVCPPPKQNMLGAEPFISQIYYTEMDSDRPKGIKVTVALPHYDGLFPAISTHEIEDSRQILISFAMRSEIHKCSNLLLANEIKSTSGFINYENKFPSKSNEPYEFDLIRGYDSIMLYKHLDLKSCLWNFEAFFTLSEVIKNCGASILSESNSEQDEASVILEMPLYVSYISSSRLGWQQINSATTLKLKFSYKTSTMIKGDMMDQEVNTYEVHLSATNMYISTNGSLVVYFRTKPKFIGFYIYKIPGSQASKVVNLDKSDLQLTLSLLSNLSDSGSVEQSWKFFSDVASVDYSGRYEITLIPCVCTNNFEVCTPRDPVSYTLDVQFQQIGDPVLHKYTLDTDFQLIKGGASVDDTSVFQPGDYVHGIIAVVPPQEDISLNIEKCYLCSGKNGYIPKYNPDKKEFGCLMETPDLQYSLKIIDRNDVDSVQKVFYNRYFNATISQESCLILFDNSIANNLKNCDGFFFDVTPLFNQYNSKIWYIQCIYSINLSNNKNRLKRSLQEQNNVTIAMDEYNKRGTNMHILLLNNVRFGKEDSQILPSNNHIAISRINNHSTQQLSLTNFLQFLIVLFIIVFVMGMITLSCSVSRLKKEVKLSSIKKYNNVGYSPCKECVTSL